MFNNKIKLRKRKLRMSNLSRQKKHYQETESQSSDSEFSVNLNLNTNNNFKNQSSNNRKNLSHNDQTNEPKKRKQIILDRNDLVIVSPIRANNVKLCKICTDCKKSGSIVKDCALYASIIQLMLAILICAILFINFYSINKHVRRHQGYDHFSLEKCHFTLLTISFFIINFITGSILSYDLYQSNRAGYRINDFFTVLLIWSGGWAAGWMFFLLAKLSDRSRYLMSKFGLLLTLFSVTSPAFYFIIRSL